jgi:protease I
MLTWWGRVVIQKYKHHKTCKEGPSMRLTGKKVIILVENLYQELEVWYPLLRLKEEGADTFTVGSGSSDSYTSKVGYPVHADMKAEDVHIDEYDALIIPGGYAPDIMRRYPAMVKLVRDAFEKGKVVASICHGGWMLASADIVRGKKLTSFFAIKDDLVHAGAEWTDAEVVVDGKLITSRKPEDLPAFCREIIKVTS